MTLATTPRYDPEHSSIVGTHAVVVGGSMAGMLTARVLADYFETVTVLERDRLSRESVDRRGVPHAQQPHILWEAGRSTLEDLFPGYGEDLLAAGGLVIDLHRDFHAYDQGGFFAEGEHRTPLYCASRPLFERIVRRRAGALDRVDILSGHRCHDYLLDDEAGVVTGVAVSGEDANREEISADLVVDATGRTSRTPTWIEEHGYKPPTIDDVPIDLVYSSTRIDRPPDDRRAYFIGPDAPRTRGGAVIPIEGNQWIVNLQGVHGDHPPTDEDGFEAFAASLPIPHLERLLDAQPWVVDDIAAYPFPSSRRRRYEELDRFPDGLVVIGDAICSLNPLYGQGMSVAALEALQLHHTLAADHESDVPHRFFERAETVVDTAWRFAVGADHQFAQTGGPKPLGTDMFNWYASRLVTRAHTDSALSEAFASVVTMREPPTVLLRPGIIWRVLRPSWPAAGVPPRSASEENPEEAQ
jgi:2-polyprenyl-6-methoxyphenol hydroxylase-like FAD-dependent oxidoreductase